MTASSFSSDLFVEAPLGWAGSKGSAVGAEPTCLRCLKLNMLTFGCIWKIGRKWIDFMDTWSQVRDPEHTMPALSSSYISPWNSLSRIAHWEVQPVQSDVAFIQARDNEAPVQAKIDLARPWLRIVYNYICIMLYHFVPIYALTVNIYI